MNKSISILLLLLCLSFEFFGQIIGTTNFANLPRDYQLYPRNSSGIGTVPINGSTSLSNIKYYSVIVNRNGQKYNYQKATVNYSNGRGNFSFPNLSIVAEKANYDFSIYQIPQTGDSVLVTQVNNVVAGEVIVITGQSNSTCFFIDDRTNPFCRTFGKITDNFNTGNYNPSDTLWTLSNYNAYNFGVGTTGFELQKLILDNYGIPTCLINGGTHWSNAQQHANRTASNPADLTNTYGRLLYRIQKAGLQNAIKTFIYRQGESEAYGEGSNFKMFFNTILSNLKQDLPSIKKIYLFQIDIIENGNGYSPLVREEQRQFGIENPLIDVVPSIGTTGFDGLHYSTQGYQQTANELFRLMSRDIFGAVDDGNFSAPNIQKAYYTTPERNQIALFFQKGQQLTWPEAFSGSQIKDYFYLSGNNGQVKSGKIYKNAILLDLFGSNPSNNIGYLPPIVNKGDPLFPYMGPYITNSLGMRALTFYQYPIGDYSAQNPIPGNTDPVISFSKIPQNAQMLPREANNLSTIQIKATLQESPVKYEAISLLTTRNNQKYSYTKKTLVYTNAKTDIDIAATIKAELATYGFKLYAIVGTDSLLLAEKTDLLSGDYFLVMGQSNAQAWHTENNTTSYSYNSPYARTFGVKNSADNALADTTWEKSNEYPSKVGVWAMELQRKLIEQYGIPSTVINASAPLSTISQQNSTTGSTDDLSTVYGRMLYKIKKAGATSQIKAIYWWGGDYDARTNSSTSYPSEFDKLYKRLRTDFASNVPLYTFQSNIYNNASEDAGKMREFQRNIPKLYTNTTVFSSLGYDGFNGLNGQYTLEGYTQIANTLWNSLNNDLYANTKSTLPTSPQIQKVFYTDSNKKTIVAVFDEGQSLIWPKDLEQNGNKYEMRFYFYQENSSSNNLSGIVTQNQLTITNLNKSTAKTLSYLPDYIPSNLNPNDTRSTYNGPFLRNTQGLTAFSFKNFPIADALESPTLSVSKSSSNSLDITWKSIANATSYILELYKASNGVLLKQSVVSGTTTNITFASLEDKTQYLIKAKVISATSESPYSTISALTFNALKAPTLTGSATYYNTIQLNWTTTDTDILGYILERKTSDASSFTVVSQANAGTNTFSENNLLPNTIYQYRIKSKNSVTESPYATLEIKTPSLLTTPSLRAVGATEFTVNLSWDKVDGASTYQIEKDAGNNNFQILIKTDANTLTYTDKQLEANTTYSYRIKAFSSISESNYAFATAKTLIILGTDNPSFSKAILYPNPNNGKFILKFEKPFSGDLRVIDFLGREIFGIRLLQCLQKELDLSYLPSGTYILNCQSENIWHSFQFQMIPNP